MNHVNYRIYRTYCINSWNLVPVPGDLKDAGEVISLSSFSSLTMDVRTVRMVLALFAVIIISMNLINYVDGAPTETSTGRYYYDVEIPDDGVQDQNSHRYLFRPNYNCPPGSKRDFRGRCKVVY
ncbi:hypothetical protein Trydic_g9699 [Trypoxylus dichotomus]